MLSFCRDKECVEMGFKTLQSDQYRGFVVNVRESRAQQDEDIVAEVLVHDCYKLRILNLLGLRPKTVLDVGGHIGTFALAVKYYWPEVRVIAFEPCRESFELYQKNVVDNHLADVEVYNAAIAYDPSRSLLLDGEGSTGGCVLKNAEQAQALENAPRVSGQEHYHVIQQNVELMNLDQFLLDAGIQAVDLAKFDCEGSEIEIFERISPDMAAKFGGLLGEYHVEGGLNKVKHLALRAFSHLAFMGDAAQGPVGSFWALPKGYYHQGFRILYGVQSFLRCLRNCLRQCCCCRREA